VGQIAASIAEFSFTNPVLTDGHGGIIAGHGRVLAALKLGMAKVPCIELAHLSEAQRRAYAIADNKIALNAGWDEELLAAELVDLEALGFDLDLTGFGVDEIEALVASQAANEGLTDPDDVPPPGATGASGCSWRPVGAGASSGAVRRRHGGDRCGAGAGRGQAAPDGHRPALWDIGRNMGTEGPAAIHRGMDIRI
ncbi:hypothetical protein LCGC14_2934160, partial [marine sediment metagenome]